MKKMIYLEDAINAVDYACEELRGVFGRCEEKLLALPSAQPDLDEWCTDCKEYDPEKHSCPRFNRVVRETVEEIKWQQPEIIRCGECKNRKTDDCPMYYEETVEWDDGDGYIEVDYVPHDRTVDDGFCHNAERKADP